MFKIQSICLFGLIILFLSFSSCATIVGGANYYAKVIVVDHPNATIEHEGVLRGRGEAMFRASRVNANEFSVTIKEEGCKTETKHFTRRRFRFFAFLGTVVGFTGFYMGIPLPWGILVDSFTGALWRPDVREKGVSKEGYKDYIYRIEYTGCPSKALNLINLDKEYSSQLSRLKKLKKLFDEGLITKEEFDREKQKIFDEDN